MHFNIPLQAWITGRHARKGGAGVKQCRNKKFESQLTSNILSPIPGNNGPFDCARLVLVLSVREGCVFLSFYLPLLFFFSIPAKALPFDLVRSRSRKSVVKLAQLVRVFRGMSSGKVRGWLRGLNILPALYKLTWSR